MSLHSSKNIIPSFLREIFGKTESYIPGDMHDIMKNKRGFSTVVAMMITAFLVVISAGILETFMNEGRINKSLYQGISTYAGAEGSLEYAMLKIKNHREGFQDKLVKDKDDETKLLAIDPENITNKDQLMIYEIEYSSGKYEGKIKPGEFHIIPLFFDTGSLIQENAKNPNIDTSDIRKTHNFTLTPHAAVSWNIIGNDSRGMTYGITGSGSSGQPITRSTIGAKKYLDRNQVVRDEISIDSFLKAYQDNYMILYNFNDIDLSYSMTSDNAFTLPEIKITGAGEMMGARQNIEFKESRSRFFDILKYSIFTR